MPDRASDRDLKLARAQEHIETLELEVEQYLRGPHRPRVVSTRRRGPGGVLTFDLSLAVPREPPARWSSVVSDALHNMRSALDCRAFFIVNQQALDIEQRHQI